MQGSLAKLEARGARVAAISVDSLATSSAWAKENGVSFPIVADVDRAITKAYGLFDASNDIAWPAAFVIDRRGHVTWRDLSDSYKERPTPPRLLAALDAIRGDASELSSENDHKATPIGDRAD